MASSAEPITTVAIIPPPSVPVAEPPLTGIQAISIKKTLMLLNNFILTTSDFLNHFSSLCEHKLSVVSQQVHRVEIVIALLEAKLESVAWLHKEGGAAVEGATPIVPPTIVDAPPIEGADASSSSSSSSAPVVSSSAPSAPPLAVAPVVPLIAAAPVLKLRDDVRYAKYFKMMAMGVPKPAIKIKMTTDGVDASQIDRDPDSEAPAGGRSQALVVVQNDDSDSDASGKMTDDEEGN